MEDLERILSPKDRALLEERRRKEALKEFQKLVEAKKIDPETPEARAARERLMFSRGASVAASRLPDVAAGLRALDGADEIAAIQAPGADLGGEKGEVVDLDEVFRNASTKKSPEEAARAWAHCFGLARRAGNGPKACEAAHRQCKALRELGQVRAAIKCAETLLFLSTKLKYTMARLSALKELTELHQDVGETAIAKRYWAIGAALTKKPKKSASHPPPKKEPTENPDAFNASAWLSSVVKPDDDPLVLAALRGDWKDILQRRMLGVKDAGNRKLESSGVSLLHAAALANRADLVAPLVASGADLNSVDSTGASPLTIAAGMRHSRIATELVNKGARELGMVAKIPTDCLDAIRDYIELVDRDGVDPDLELDLGN